MLHRCSLNACIPPSRTAEGSAQQRDTGPVQRKGGRGKAVSDTGVFKAQPLWARLCPFIQPAAFLPVVRSFHVPSTHVFGARAVSGVNEWPCAGYSAQGPLNYCTTVLRGRHIVPISQILRGKRARDHGV